MKPAERNLNVQSTLQGDKIGMSIDEGALAHIMSVLTDLYSDPEMAVVREYSTNAFDAHVEAGVSLPIEVSLPSELSPYLKIRDYGLGLDAEDIRDIYSRYGASTKRDTNDQIGSLGLGCKSALTYTDQFTLRGIKNGIATEVAISRDEDGSGSMTIASTYETEEASGVLITIPAKRWNSFEEKARQLFQFWADGTVLVNGEEPKQFDGLEIADNVYIVGKDDLDGFERDSVVVMGGVPYTFVHDYRNQFSIVAFVGMGEVQFTPNREALQMTAQTKEVIAKIVEAVSVGRQGAAQRLVDKAQNKIEALDIALRMNTMLGLKDDLTFKGKVIPNSFGGGKGEKFHFIVYKPNNQRRYYDRKISTEPSLPISMARKSIFFRGYKNQTLGPTPLVRLKGYFEQQGIDRYGLDTVVFCDELPNATWVEPSRIHNWADVAAIKMPKKQSVSGRVVGSYDGFFNGVRQTEVSAEDFEDVPVYWYDYSCGMTHSDLTILTTAFDSKLILIELKANRIAKFERMFPETKNAHELVREVSQAWFDNLTQDERDFFAVQSIADDMKKLDAKKVEDPHLKNLIKMANKKNDTLVAKERSFRYYYVGEFESVDLNETYPLFDLDGMHYKSTEEKANHMKHTYLYLNAVYNSRKDGQ